MSNGAVDDHYGKNVWGGGINIGIGRGYFGYISYTFLAPPPPPNFWIRSGRH